MNTYHSFRIVHLTNMPDAMTTLVRWFAEEWAPWYGLDGPGDAEEDLKACRSRNKLPICLVALNEEDDVLGTATLKSESVGSELGVGPWLAAVLVDKGHRDEGIGTALVEAIENEAHRLGFEAIYTSSNSAGSILTRRQWNIFGSTDSLRGPQKVYCKHLTIEAPKHSQT